MATLIPLEPLDEFPERLWTVFDFEWNTKYRLTLCGAYDERGYRSYDDCDDFIRGELTGPNRKRKFWAHAMGLSDISFILDSCHRMKIPYRIDPIGSAAVKCKIGKHHFQDSYWVLRAPLGKIGESLGLEKPGLDFDTDNREEIEIRNLADNEILWKALHYFADIVESHGSRMRNTIAATALELFRRSYQTKAIAGPPAIEPTIRRAYIASNVDVRQRSADEAWYWDINSSFPKAMTGPLPCVYIGRDRRNINTSRFMAFVRAKVCVPKSEDIPCLPFRTSDGSIVHPTGTWEGIFTEEELEYASGRGYDITTREYYLYTKTGDFSRYVHDIFNRRVEARRAGQEALALVLKFLLNALYGKFGQGSEQETYLWDIILGHKRKRVRRRPFHSQPHVSAWIGARSRLQLHRLLILTLGRGYEPYYWDTDGFWSNCPDMETGSKLGDLKLEGHYHDCLFAAPKLYKARDSESGEILVKAKGYPMITDALRQHDIETAELLFDILVRRGTIHGEQMMRFREKLRRQVEAGGKPIKKSAYFYRKKRCFDSSGKSRPWDVSELW